MSEPLDRPAECDIIMKGGITSGVVYPLAVCELARHYKFRNIGGTSAGAIAAALTAAAEFRRETSESGFEKLRQLPEELGTRLLSLFQPSPGTRPAFQVLLAFLGTDSKKKKTLRAVDRILSLHWPTALLGALLGMGLWGLLVLLPLWRIHGELGVWLLPGLGIFAFFFAVLAALVRFGWGTWNALNANGFGLCKGLSQIEGQAALTPWLSEELNQTAGLSPKGDPLTFGQLWGDGDRAAQLTDPSLRKVNLEVMTTCLTQGWPQRIPFVTKDLFFDPQELRGYFPEEVVSWMEKHPWSSEDPKSLRRRVMAQTRFLPLPAPWDFPVVVAARMSLSFPGLISAVPLYGVDWSQEDNQKADREGQAPRLERCWFSDGGIGSNFPVHFFDGLLPSRPTFGVNLRPLFPRKDGAERPKVDFPATAREEVLPTWTPIPDALRFATKIIDTMQNWVDNTQMRLPGYRDRVVHIMLSNLEGGMNLNMEKDLIEELSLRGQEAGKILSGFDWEGHRWTRYLTAMSQLQLRLDRMERVYAKEFREFLIHYNSSKKPYAHSASWKGSAIQKTDSLLNVIQGWRGIDQAFTDGAPRPETELRIGPKR